MSVVAGLIQWSAAEREDGGVRRRCQPESGQPARGDRARTGLRGGPQVLQPLLHRRGRLRHGCVSTTLAFLHHFIIDYFQHWNLPFAALLNYADCTFRDIISLFVYPFVLVTLLFEKCEVMKTTSRRMSINKVVISFAS